MRRISPSSAGQSSHLTFWMRVGLACGLLALAGVVDYFSDVNVIVAPFYLLPITLATWKIGKRTGFCFCFLATAMLMGINAVQEGYFEARQLWNAGVWCSLFIAFAMLCIELKGLDHHFPLGRLLLKACMVSAIPVGLLTASLVVRAKSESHTTRLNIDQINPFGSGRAITNTTALLSELIHDTPQSLQSSRAVLLGSRDLNGPSCVPVVLAGDLHDTLPAKMADLDGGPGTKLALLLNFDRQQIKGPQEDFEWHQSRLKSFLQTEQGSNRLAMEHAKALSERSTQLLEIINSWTTWPGQLPEVRFDQEQSLTGYCLHNLSEAIHAHDLPQTKRWAAELASATFATQDLHRWLALLIENHLTALDFQQKCASLFAAADPAMRGKYDLSGAIGGFPGGGWTINGIWNDYEVERQAERLFNIRRGLSADAPIVLSSGDAIWLAPNVRDAFAQLKQAFSPANQKTWLAASHSPFDRSFIVSMLYRMQRAGVLDQLAVVLKRFDAAHPNATIPEMMDVLMYRGNGFAGLEWADRFQPPLMSLAEQVHGSELDVFRMAHKLTNDFYRMPVDYGVTLTLREALEQKKLDCVRSTDMIGTIFRDAGRSGFGNVRWSSETATHSIAALLSTKDGKPLTLLTDGMTEYDEPELWPDAFFNGHAWPERFKDNPNPYAVELNVRGLDNYLWAEGYIVRGPNAGTLQKAAIPYLLHREQSSTEKIFAGPYPN